MTLDHFRCLSQANGVLCTVIGSGKGFLINSTGITRVGQRRRINDIAVDRAPV